MDLYSAMEFFHLVFAAVWAGSVVFVAWGVLPAVANGSISSGSLRSISRRLVLLSRVSAVILLVSGGLMAGRYGDSIASTTPGYLVLAMTILWLLLIGFVELAGRTLSEGLDEADVTEAVSASRGRFRTAGVVALLLLIDAGLLSAL